MQDLPLGFEFALAQNPGSDEIFAKPNGNGTKSVD